ncbi:MAG TPA: cystathionine gamma-synthase [Rhodothermales bacterium]|nr:cystathionine gamma-synthase [Rhodothermales bacterium]
MSEISLSDEMQQDIEDRGQGFATKAVHAGQRPDPSTGAIMTPVFFTSTYVQRAPGEHLGYEYARVSNPTRDALEGNLAALENARHGICYASGVASIDALIKSLEPGDHIISGNDLYGGTYRLFRQTFERYGFSFTFVNMSHLENVERAIQPNTKLIWLETPTNPLMRVIDLRALSTLAASRSILVAVDNTFATPYLQRPLDLGCDIVMHSTTKYLAGHSDIIGGAICTSHDEIAEKLRFQVKTSGAVPGPMDCYLILRGTKTLHVRMDRHCSNARRVAEYLELHPKVATVHYPGLESDPGHETATAQMSDFGGMMSFVLKDDRMETANRVLSSTRLFALAESLGGVESLIGHPASMTHASIPPEIRHAAGLSDSLIRVSVGIEDPEDLIADLERALETV